MEIKDLQSLVAALTVKAKEGHTSDKNKRSQQASEFVDESHDVKALKKKVKKLRQQIKGMTAQPTTKEEKKLAQDGTLASSVKFTRSKVSGSPKNSEDYFCYSVEVMGIL